MKRNDNLVRLSIYLIKNIWHGGIGEEYNKRRNIICRFYPSCSNYAIRALRKYGFSKGWNKTINRIKRCNSWNTESCIDYP